MEASNKRKSSVCIRDKENTPYCTENGGKITFLFHSRSNPFFATTASILIKIYRRKAQQKVNK